MKVLDFDFGITVDTIENFIENPTSDEIVIIDEFDYVMMNKAFHCCQKKI
jgi:hypothetical protein